MTHSQPIVEVIRRRFSSRTYRSLPVAPTERQLLADYLATLRCGPLGAPARFELIAATEQERDALRGLGTYGIIRGASGFIVGAVQDRPRCLEDYGYLMEQAILRATDLGLGTCWLGGNFTRSSFSRKIALAPGEVLPAVASVGYSAVTVPDADLIRRVAGSTSRLPANRLFFDGRFDEPLSPAAAGAYAIPLEMVRLGPSASNKQPWRIVRDGDAWHFYLQRTPGYRDRFAARLLRLADMQRVDMGIAMCHFALAAAELGLQGRWLLAAPPPPAPDALTEYIVTWQAAIDDPWQPFVESLGAATEDFMNERDRGEQQVRYW